MAGKSNDESKKSKDVAVATPKPEISALGVEMGVDNNLAFTSPFSPVGVGIRKTPDEELQEVLRDESEEYGPTTRQLVVMRRQDGQARALYRLLVLPLRAALTNSEFIADSGETESEKKRRLAAEKKQKNETKATAKAAAEAAAAVPADPSAPPSAPGAAPVQTPEDDLDDGPKPGDEEAEFISNIFSLAPNQGGMTVTFHRFMSQLLLALFDGFSAFEKVYWSPRTGPLQGKITLKKLAYRPSDTITFIADKEGGFAGLRQRANVNGRSIDAFIEPKYAFYYAAQEEERKFYGVSFFQSAFYHYDKKVKLYFTAHLAAQRAAVGTRVGTVPANAGPAAKKEFAQAMANLAFAQSIMLPEGFEVDVLSETSNFDFLAMVNHHNNQMSKSVLAGFFDKETGAGQSEGSLVNFAQPGDDMFVLMLRTIMDEIANQINHYIIPDLIDWNFGSGRYPKFTWGKLTDEQKAAIAKTFDTLASAETVTPEFIRELEKHQAEEFGLDIDWDAVDEREREEKAMELALNSGAQLGPDGKPLDPTALGAAAIPEGAEESVESLDDIVSLMVAKVDAEDGAAPVAGASGGANPLDPKKKRPTAPSGRIGLSDDLIDYADTVIAGRSFGDG